MDIVKNKPSINELRAIKAVTGLAIGGIVTAFNDELPGRKLAVTAAGTTFATMNTSEEDTYGSDARTDAIWSTVGTVVLTNILVGVLS
ncbi:hypothetical protein [Vibrio phage 5 TSL-2019]|nr:hypothetical protein [Vibrio phage 5 TSL-2019]